MNLRFGLTISAEKLPYVIFAGMSSEAHQEFLFQTNWANCRVKCKQCKQLSSKGKEPPKHCERCYLDEDDDCYATAENLDTEVLDELADELDTQYPELEWTRSGDYERYRFYVTIPAYNEAEEPQVLPPMTELKAKFSKLTTALDQLEYKYKLKFF